MNKVNCGAFKSVEKKQRPSTVKRHDIFMRIIRSFRLTTFLLNIFSPLMRTTRLQTFPSFKFVLQSPQIEPSPDTSWGLLGPKKPTKNTTFRRLTFARLPVSLSCLSPDPIRADNVRAVSTSFFFIEWKRGREGGGRAQRRLHWQ